MNKVLERIIKKKGKVQEQNLSFLRKNGKKENGGESGDLTDHASEISQNNLIESQKKWSDTEARIISIALELAKKTDGKCPLCRQSISPKALESNVPTCFNHAKERVTQKKSLEEFLGELLEGISWIKQ